jgi:hypothetical protein
MPAQHRRGLPLRKLPACFEVPTGRQKLAAGQVKAKFLFSLSQYSRSID